MAKNLQIRIGYVDSTGTFQPWANKAVYLKPSRTDVTFLSGGVYYPWNINQNGDVGYQSYWKAVTNGTGYATFQSVPFTDTEMHRPLNVSGNPIGPEIEWLFVNPWGATGPVVYRGKLLSTMTLGATVIVPDDLIQLPSDAWTVSDFSASAQALGGKVQNGKVTFGVGVLSAAANFPIPFTAPPLVFVSGQNDKEGNFSAPAVAQDASGNPQITTSSATIVVAQGLASAVEITYMAIGN